MRFCALLLPLLPGTVALADEPDPVFGAEVYAAFCAVCHGADGRGGGPYAPALEIPPKDLTQLARENGGTFPTFRVVRQIDGRDPLLAHGGDMPIFGEAFVQDGAAIASETGQPILTYQPIADVTAYLQTLQE